MTWAIRGVIEGFYGRPWSWDERLEVMTWCHEREMTHYLYAPKDDPLHRERWREPYPAEELAGFERLVASATLEVGFGVSPGLSIDYGSNDDREALGAKVDQLVDIGVGMVCLALDDIPPRPGLGAEHAELTLWLHERLAGKATVVLVPTEYTGTVATPYLEALNARVPTDVPIVWTGPTVVCDHITCEQALARTDALGGRPPLIWDNYPVNDAIMADRLFLGPLRGRERGLGDVCSGYVANPMVQPRASKLPLASTAAFLRNEDEEHEWAVEADRLGWRTFAEACDGEVPGALVAGLRDAAEDRRSAHIGAIRTWLEDLDEFVPPDEIATEVGPWVEQAKQEMGVWRAALRVLRALDRNDGERATNEGMGLLFLWPPLRRADRSVMGPRQSFRPVFGQWPDGSWRYDAESLQEDRNATDALARFALAELARWTPSDDD